MSAQNSATVTSATGLPVPVREGGAPDVAMPTAPPERPVAPASPTTPSAVTAPVPAAPAAPVSEAEPPVAANDLSGRPRTGRALSEAERPAPAAPPQLRPAAAPTTRALSSGPASQVFAAAIRRVARDVYAVPAPEPQALAAPSVHAMPVSLPASASLDLRQDQWPGAMIERIERLRDTADAADTRIRLVPDTLGAVEVSVRREGEAVHVHFAAEQAATRALIQDAAPRLAEAAEARGLKLGQMGVGGGGADADGRRQQDLAPGTTVTPGRARLHAAGEDETDTRIA